MRFKRLLEINKEEAKELKKKLKEAKNSVEAKRIMIMINYLRWSNTDKVVKNLWVSKWTVLNTIHAYIKDKENFYKTNFTWKRASKKSKKIKERIKNIIEDKLNKWELVDIKDIEEEYNKKSEEKLEYYQVWWYIRKVLWYNYQKPEVKDKRQDEHAEEIFKWRLTKAIIEIWIEEKEIDAHAIKNKKTIFREN